MLDRENMKKHVNQDIEKTQKKAIKFVKKHAVHEAAKVIKIIEDMAVKNLLEIDPNAIKNTVINNLVDRNRNRYSKNEKEHKSYIKEKEQWSI